MLPTLHAGAVTLRPLTGDDAEAVVRWETTPGGRTLDWFRALVRAQADPATDWAALLRDHADVFRLA